MHSLTRVITSSQLSAPGANGRDGSAVILKRPYFALYSCHVKPSASPLCISQSAQSSTTPSPGILAARISADSRARRTGLEAANLLIRAPVACQVGNLLLLRSEWLPRVDRAAAR